MSIYEKNVFIIYPFNYNCEGMYYKTLKEVINKVIVLKRAHGGQECCAFGNGAPYDEIMTDLFGDGNFYADIIDKRHKRVRNLCAP